MHYCKNYTVHSMVLRKKFCKNICSWKGFRARSPNIPRSYTKNFHPSQQKAELHDGRPGRTKHHLPRLDCFCCPRRGMSKSDTAT